MTSLANEVHNLPESLLLPDHHPNLAGFFGTSVTSKSRSTQITVTTRPIPSLQALKLEALDCWARHWKSTATTSQLSSSSITSCFSVSATVSLCPPETPLTSSSTTSISEQTQRRQSHDCEMTPVIARFVGSIT